MKIKSSQGLLILLPQYGSGLFASSYSYSTYILETFIISHPNQCSAPFKFILHPAARGTLFILSFIFQLQVAAQPLASPARLSRIWPYLPYLDWLLLNSWTPSPGWITYALSIHQASICNDVLSAWEPLSFTLHQVHSFSCTIPPRVIPWFHPA